MNPKLHRKRREEMSDESARFERAHYKRLRHEKNFSEDERGWAGQYGQHPVNEEEQSGFRTETGNST